MSARCYNLTSCQTSVACCRLGFMAQNNHKMHYQVSSILSLNCDWDCCILKRFNSNSDIVHLQLNLHETDLLFWYLSHHLTWHCLLISVFIPVLVCCDHKIVVHWYQNKNNLVIMLRKSWEIVRNQLTILCQIVANISKL